MLIGVPSLIFLLLSRAPISEFNFQMLSGYFFTEIVLYLTGFLIAKFIFHREIKEAALIGLCIALTNHVLFVLPIAETLFGEKIRETNNIYHHHGWTNPLCGDNNFIRFS